MAQNRDTFKDSLPIVKSHQKSLLFFTARKTFAQDCAKRFNYEMW